MPKKAKTNLRWDNDSMTWRDSDNKAVQHPRYMDKPRSLDSKTFRKAYLSAVRQGASLNDFMKFHGKYDMKLVQAAARKMKKAYEDVTEAAGQKDSFKLLRQRKEKKGGALGLEIAGLLVAEGLRDEGDPRIAQLKND